MAQKLAFGASGGSTSWADDDDLDASPVPFATSLPKVEEQERPRAESPVREQQHQPERRDRKYSNESHDREQGRGYGDRGDRAGYRSERRDDHGPRGGYEDRAPRGGYKERPKNPVPDHGPFKLFVGNIPFHVSENDIADFFGAADAIVDVRIQRDPDTDRPKGFAYVEFRDRDALVEALKLDGQNFDGRQVHLDAATEPRKQRQGGSFFEKRGDRGDRGGFRNERRGQDDAPRERPRLTLQPRTAPAEAKDPEAQRKSIFGDAKPRDEAAILERKKAMDAERKAKAEQAKKNREPREPREPRESRQPRERKTSRDDSDARPAGGRGGRGRGERTERGAGRGRGGQQGAHAAAAPAAERTPAKKEEAKKEEANVEPKLPKAVKLPAPAATKTKNAFELLNASDSDSD